MTVLKDDGLYRHLRFCKPDNYYGSFNLITWPGYLAYCGDMGDYVFARLPDMFDFFRGNGSNIDTRYWAEKIKAEDRSDGVMKYCKDKAKNWIKESIADCALTKDQRDAIDGINYNDGEDELRRQLRDDDAISDLFINSWDSSFQEYTERFKFCCFALVWGIHQYDKTKTEGSAP